MTTHVALRIIKGVGAAVGDPNSAEQPIEVINLLAGADGFALESWTPSYPANKGGGVFADSPVSDGRLMLAAAKQQVVETMQLTVGTSHVPTRFALLSQLMRMAEDAEKQWTTAYQIEPVYLEWHAPGAPVPQYALITSIQIAQRGEIFETLNAWDLTITIEREPAWRMLVPPGGNPKLWTKYAAGEHPGEDFDYTDLSLYEGTDHLVYETITNHTEWDYTDYVTPLTKNWIDIPAEDIPGDAPALVCLSLARSNDTMYEVRDYYLGRSTKPFSATTHDGTPEVAATGTLNAGDASALLSPGAKSSGSGFISNGSNVTLYHVSYAFTTATFSKSVGLTWGTGGFKTLDMHLQRGKYACFVRCNVNTGSAGDLLLSLRFKWLSSGKAASSNTIVELPQVPDVPVRANGPDLLYMGAITLPFGENVVQSLEGYGPEISGDGTSPENLTIDLMIQKVSTAARTFKVYDLILMPFDEAMVHTLYSDTALVSPSVVVLDSTGYLTHGKPQQIARRLCSDADDAYRYVAGGTIEHLGTDLTLVPGVDNRVYMANREYHTSGEIISHISDLVTDVVRLNIVPRCYGIASL